MNCIRFVYIKDVFLLHQNENGRKELCKWKKFCECCGKKRRHTRARTRMQSILFTSIELDLWWGNHVMQNENKTTCDKWVSKEKERRCHVAKANWKLSDAKETCVCESDARVRLPLQVAECVLLSQSKLATCVHFISFYLWFGGVFDWMLWRKNIFISWFKWISAKWFNVARHLYPDMNSIKQNSGAHTWNVRLANAYMVEHTLAHILHTQKTQLQRIIRFVPRHWCYRSSSEQYI